MAIEFRGRDLVVRFKENELNAQERLYQVRYACALTDVIHNVDEADFYEQDPDTQIRRYVDTLRYEENLANGLTRSPVVSLRTQMANGNWSEWQDIEANNPRPVLVGTPLIERTLTGVQLRNVMPEDTDLVGFAVWLGDEPGFPMDDAHLVHQGASSTIDVALPTDATHYLRIAPYDAFGLDAASAWDELQVRRKALGAEIVGSSPWQQLPDLVTNLLQEPIDRLSSLHLEYGKITVKKSIALAEENMVAVETLRTYVDETGAIVAEDLTQLTSRVGTQEAGLLLLNETYADDKEATASQLIDLVARTDENEAQIVIERTARTTQHDSLAQIVTTVSSKTNQNTAAIQDAVVTFTNADTAQASRINLMETRVGNAETTISSIQTTVNNGQTAFAQDIQQLGVRINTEKSQREAAISTVNQARIDGDQVLTQSVNTLSSAINTPNTGILAVIQNNATASSNANSARATEINSIQSRINNVNGEFGASLEQKMTTLANIDGKLTSAYTLKVQQDYNGRSYIAGMGLAMQNGVSSIAFSADSFRITTPGGLPRQVFYADSNGVHMDSAFIGQISSDSITVTNANIQNLSINGDKMMVDAVTSIGSYETNYYGWRDNNSYAWLYPGGSEWSAPRATVRTGNGDSKALITIMGVWERDGSDDDNVNVSIERRGGSSGTTYLSERVNVQVANGRRTFGFQWVDNYLEDYVDYTYILVFRKIGGDGSPYWHNATFNVVCFKK